MDYLEAAKEFQERLCGEARANTEKLWWASTKFPEELAAWVSALLDKVRQEQAAECANHAYDVIRWNFTLPELNASALSAGLASPRWNALEKQLAKAPLAAPGRK